MFLKNCENHEKNECKILQRPRGAGKTTALITTSAITEYPIMVVTRREEEFLKEYAESLNLKIPSPLTAFLQFLSGMSGLTGSVDNPQYTKILIDEYDAVYEYFVKVTLNKIEESSLGETVKRSIIYDILRETPIEFLSNELYTRGYNVVAATTSYTEKEIKKKGLDILNEYILKDY